MALSLKNYVAKLNSFCRSTMETAAGLCLSRTNFNVEIEHWFLKMLESEKSDLTYLLKHYDINPSRLIAEINRVVDGFKTGNARTPALSPDIATLIREAWVIASVEYGSQAVRSGHLLIALLSDKQLSLSMARTSPELAALNVEKMIEEFITVAERSEEAASDYPAGGFAPVGATGDARTATPGARPGSKHPGLDQYTVNLTERARAGELDPVLGRDPEIRQIIDILTRRRQNNPILTGEAGVGKTAVVEGFAQKIAIGDVPPALQEVDLHTLDLGLLQAGAGMKGEFENRLKSVIDEVKASPRPIILFIDEAHTMIGAGGSAGQGDAANLLKPALARGELRTIAATTWAEYKKYFEKDPALARRFQVVKIEEPSIEVAEQMMRGFASTLETHHEIRILEEAIEESVRLSSRYISGRQLPDKSVSLLDTATAKVATSLTTIPAAVDDRKKAIEQYDVLIAILEREAATGTDNAERLEELLEKKKQTEEELETMTERWEKEKVLVDKIRQISDALLGEMSPKDEDAEEEVEADTPEDATAEATAEATEEATDDDPKPTIEDLQKLREELAELQGEEPLLQAEVDGQSIAAIVSSWTGIPVGRMVSDEIRTVLNLREEMEKRIVGQSHALESIAQSVRTSRASLTDPRRPIGIFLLVGTSGVGKTETALTLADLLYGGEQNMTTLNMSEYKEEHKTSLLMGSPPGYVGYGEGGVLTEAVRRRPYSVVLLDEMEKAHPGIQDVFYQVFDKGIMTDGEGRDIDFKNTLVIMTSNAATDLVMELCKDPENFPSAEELRDALHDELTKTFKPAFLGRVTVVPYFPLPDKVLQKITGLQLGRIGKRMEEHHHAKFTFGDELLAHIAARCTDVDSGARNIDHILTGTMLPELSSEILERMANEEEFTEVHVGLADDGTFKYTIT